jgi:hypothetical protein
MFSSPMSVVVLMATSCSRFASRSFCAAIFCSMVAACGFLLCAGARKNAARWCSQKRTLDTAFKCGPQRTCLRGFRLSVSAVQCISLYERSVTGSLVH